MDTARCAPGFWEHTSANGRLFDSDGLVAVDTDHRDQYLLAVYSTHSLSRRLASMTALDASMKELVGVLNLERVAVPRGFTDDVDTRQDAAGLGVTR